MGRWKAVNKLVKLSSVGMEDVFSLAPLTLRELCDLGRGQYGNHYVKGCQTNEDHRTLDTQTEDVRLPPLVSSNLSRFPTRFEIANVLVSVVTFAPG